MSVIGNISNTGFADQLYANNSENGKVSFKNMGDADKMKATLENRSSFQPSVTAAGKTKSVGNVINEDNLNLITANKLAGNLAKIISHNKENASAAQANIASDKAAILLSTALEKSKEANVERLAKTKAMFDKKIEMAEVKAELLADKQAQKEFWDGLRNKDQSTFAEIKPKSAGAKAMNEFIENLVAEKREHNGSLLQNGTNRVKDVQERIANERAQTEAMIEVKTKKRAKLTAWIENSAQQTENWQEELDEAKDKAKTKKSAKVSKYNKTDDAVKKVQDKMKQAKAEKRLIR